MKATTHTRTVGQSYTVDRETWLAATTAAGAAPSIHNTQPWRFVVGPDKAEVHLDLGRVLPVADPELREARISCGAAMFTLAAALRAAGVVSTTSVLPVRSHPTLLAIVRPGSPAPATARDLELHAAVPRRRSHRRPFHPDPVAPSVLNEMVYAAGRRRRARSSRRPLTRCLPRWRC